MFRLLFSRPTNPQGLCAPKLFDNDCCRYLKLRHRGVPIILNTHCPDEHNGKYAQQAADAVEIM